MIDHPISVIPEGWDALVRIVAYLHTDLTLDTTEMQPAWPFENDEQWLQHEHLLAEHDLPKYDPEIHNLQVNPWWNRIPSSVGFAILGAILLVVMILITLS